MGFLNDFKEFRRQKKAESEKDTVQITNDPLIEWKNLATWLGVSDVEDKALSEATYFACMKVLSEAIGKLPLKLLRHTDKDGIVSYRYRMGIGGYEGFVLFLRTNKRDILYSFCGLSDILGSCSAAAAHN